VVRSDYRRFRSGPPPILYRVLKKDRSTAQIHLVMWAVGKLFKEYATAAEWPAAEFKDRIPWRGGSGVGANRRAIEEEYGEVEVKQQLY
jgi:hypothetical protein